MRISAKMRKIGSTDLLSVDITVRTNLADAGLSVSITSLVTRTTTVPSCVIASASSSDPSSSRMGCPPAVDTAKLVLLNWGGDRLWIHSVCTKAWRPRDAKA